MKAVTTGACDPLPGMPGAVAPFGYPASVQRPRRRLADLRAGQKPSCGMWGHRNGPNQVLIRGDMPIAALMQSLAVWLGRVRLVDQTGVSDRFNFVLQFVLEDNAPGCAMFPEPSFPTRERPWMRRGRPRSFRRWRTNSG
jgi:hypothetical protein